MTQDTIFCGSGKAITTQYGELMKISIGPEDLQKIIEGKTEKGWVNLVLKKRKEVGKYGETHYLNLDQWKPEKQDQTTEVVDGGPSTW